MMRLGRLAIGAALLGLVAVPVTLHAETWPSRPVKIIVPAPTGVAPDIIARLVAERISTPLGQQFIVENYAGAGGIPGMSRLVRSAPDGYTFALVAASTVTLTPYLFKNPQFDVDRDLMPVAAIGTSPMMIAVGANSGITTLAELIARAKAQPGALNFGYPLKNSVPDLTGAMLNRAAGIEITPVVYNGSVAEVAAALSGEATGTIDGLPPLVGQVKAGTLRALAVTSRQRLPGYEQVPTVAETFPDFESIGWFATFAPAGTPPEVVGRLNAAINAAIRMPDIIERFAVLGVYPNPGTPEQLAAFVATQRRQWKAVIDAVGLEPQ
ncbi:MAG TPA: tripartite tricarboxylate transporter substrate binding protein [Alphaproteobacteria bacterium]|nr:tripartite tricarboxylate transporter substrate binding protein [Alphaproteobacteria bacterium]